MISEQFAKVLDTDFEQVLVAFKYASQFDGLKRRFVLVRLAPYCGIPRAEFIKPYGIWLSEGGAA